MHECCILLRKCIRDVSFQNKVKRKEREYRLIEWRHKENNRDLFQRNDYEQEMTQ